MFTTQQAQEFMLSYQSEVKFLSRMTAKNLRVVHSRTMHELGYEMLMGGPVSKDELITAILELHEMGVDKINEATHVLYHVCDTPNEACRECRYEWIVNCPAVHDEIFAATSELPLANFADGELRIYLEWLDYTGRKSSARVIREELETLKRSI